MCQFTLLAYTECNHEMLSSTAPHTRLCAYALMVELIQGIDTAPPPCFPCPSTALHIAGTHRIFDYCPDCLPVANAEEPSRTYRGDLDEVLQIHPYTNDDDAGIYDEAETSQLADLRVYIDAKINLGMALAETLESFLPANPLAKSRIPSPTLRALLSFSGPQKYENLFLAALRTCADMLPVLDLYVARNVSGKLFADTFKWAHDRALRASAVLDTFHIVVEAIVEGEGFEARLECVGDVLVRAAGGMGSHAAVEGCFGEGVEDGAGDEHPLAGKEEMAALAVLVEKTGANKPSRKEAGTLNMHGLKFESKSLGGLLEHEDANEVELDVVHFPEGVDGVRVDVEDEHGNKLVWDGEGKSRVIFAEEPKAITLSSTTKSESHAAKPPAAKPEKVTKGFGFDYSDSESDIDKPTKAHVEFSLPSPLSVAAGLIHTRLPTATPYPPTPASPPSSDSSSRKRKSPSPPADDGEDDDVDQPVQQKRRKSWHLRSSAPVVRDVLRKTVSAASLWSTCVSGSSTRNDGSSVKREPRQATASAEAGEEVMTEKSRGRFYHVVNFT